MLLLARRFAAGWGLVPLVLVLAAALYGPLSQKHGWTRLPFFGRDYPVQLDLEEVTRLTLARDAQRAERALHNAARERAYPLALIMPVTPSPEVDANQEAGSATVGGGQSLNASDVAGLQAGNAAPGRGFIALDFDLAGNGDLPGMLELSKSVQFENSDLGQIAIRIDDASRIFISSEDLMRVVPASLRPSRKPPVEFVPLQQLRDQGIDLRYDPLSDQFILRDAG